MGMTFFLSEKKDFLGYEWDVSAKCDCCGAQTWRGMFREKSEAEMFVAALEAKEAGANGVRDE